MRSVVDHDNDDRNANVNHNDGSIRNRTTTTSLLVVGLNPALQKRLVLSDRGGLVPGHVHRAASVTRGIGGKGQDVIVGLSGLVHRTPKPTPAPAPAMVSLAQFVGTGAEGEFVVEALRRVWVGCSSSGGYEPVTVRTASALRTCTSIVSANETTELVEPSGSVTPEEFAQLVSEVNTSSGTSGFDAVCVMGSMPPGCPPDAYGTIVAAALGDCDDGDGDCDGDGNVLLETRTRYCLVDSVVGLTHLFDSLEKTRRKHGGTGLVRTMLKINWTELCKLTGVSGAVPPSSSSTPPYGKEAIVREAIKGFYNVFPNAVQTVHYVAITDGKDSAYFYETKANDDDDESEGRLWRLTVPDLSRMYPNQWLYPIGAGDAVAAGTLAAWTGVLDPSLYSLVRNRDRDRDNKDVDVDVDVNVDVNVVSPLVAFAFGLACGSASCLQEENSVVSSQDVHTLYHAMDAPTLLSTP